MSSTKWSLYCAKSSAADTPCLLRVASTDPRQRAPIWGRPCPRQSAGASTERLQRYRARMVAEQTGKMLVWKLLYTTTIVRRDTFRRENNLDLPGGREHGHAPKTAPHYPSGCHAAASRRVDAPEKSRAAARATLDHRQSAAAFGAPGTSRSLYRPARSTDGPAGQSGHDCSPGVSTLFRDA